MSLRAVQGTRTKRGYRPKQVITIQMKPGGIDLSGESPPARKLPFHYSRVDDNTPTGH